LSLDGELKSLLPNVGARCQRRLVRARGIPFVALWLKICRVLFLFILSEVLRRMIRRSSAHLQKARKFELRVILRFTFLLIAECVMVPGRNANGTAFYGHLADR
jgi:hypothetical protein